MKPEFPESLRSVNGKGEVTMVGVVGTDGRVSEITVSSSTHPDLERPAVEAFSQWVFAPAQRGGVPVRFKVEQRMTFDIIGGGEPLLTIEPSLRHRRDPAGREDVPPRVENSLPAVYPWEMLVEGRWGSATIEILVDAEGAVQATRVLEATEAACGESLAAAARHWRFAPARRDGQAIPSRINFEQAFAIDTAGLLVASARDRRVAKWMRDDPARFASAKQLDERLRPLAVREPEFPRDEAAAGRTEGEAEIEFAIDTDGTVRAPRIVSASSPSFGWAAAAAVARWRFHPPKAAGEPVLARAIVPVRFRLQDPDPDPPAGPP